MNKYTINKAFQKHFSFPIWKIEVDCSNNCLAIESRNPADTIPTFTVINFNGETVLDQFVALEKEWTLEAIQGDYLIMKRFGSSSPVQAGIQVLHIPTQTLVFSHLEYVLKDVYLNQLKAVHRSIPSGLDFFIHLRTGDIATQVIDKLHLPLTTVSYPIAYQGKVPQFMQGISYEDRIWLQPHKGYFIWSYHVKEGDSWSLHLSLSSRNEILDSKRVLNDLDKLIPQPYFQVKDYIFFLSNTKQDIAAYLV